MYLMIMIYSWIKLLISVISTEDFFLKLSCILGYEYQFGLQEKNKENSNSWPFFVGRMMYTDIGNKI